MADVYVQKVPRLVTDKFYLSSYIRENENTLHQKFVWH